MSDIVQTATAGRRDEAKPFRLSPLAPYACAMVAGTAGLLVGRTIGGDAAGFEDKVLLVIRFMAALKLAAVFGAAVLLHWRLKQPIAPRLAAAYAGSLTIMAAASGLIWSLAIVAGALLFHVALIAFLILACRDDAVRLPRRR